MQQQNLAIEQMCIYGTSPADFAKQVNALLAHGWALQPGTVAGAGAGEGAAFVAVAQRLRSPEEMQKATPGTT